MDWDKNGYITPIEFKSYLQSLKKGEDMDMDEVYEAFDRMDKDGSKQIQWEEFLVRALFMIDCYFLFIFTEHATFNLQIPKLTQNGKHRFGESPNFK